MYVKRLSSSDHMKTIHFQKIDEAKFKPGHTEKKRWNIALDLWKRNAVSIFIGCGIQSERHQPESVVGLVQLLSSLLLFMHVAVIVVLFVNVLHNLQHLQFVWPLVSEFRRMKHRQTKTTVTNQCFCQILATGIVARRLNKKVCNWKLLGCCIRKMSLFRV